MKRKPSKDFSTRLAAAKQWRQAVRPTIEEIFKFCCPGREYDFTNPMKRYEIENFHSLPEELASDLASDLVSYYTPQEAIWANYNVVTEVSERDADAVREIVEERESDLFDLISTSNYNDIAPQWGFEAATHGTPAMWVTTSGPSDPIHFEVVPPHELYIVHGHRGYLDRFREFKVGTDFLEAQLAMPGIEVNLEIEEIQRKMKKKDQTFNLIHGFWLDWADPANPIWKTEITVDDHRVTDEGLKLGGPGTCPLLTGRFNPQTGRPWGRGSGWKALGDMRTLDKVEEIVLTAMDDMLKDTMIYPDDGFIDFSDGLERGKAYPGSRGFTRDKVYEFEKSPQPDAGYFQEGKLEDRLRTAFYQDGPRQSGDTPPTATQWSDERRRVQQRIGKPSAPLWTEFIKPMIQRIEYLAVQTGRIPEALSHNNVDIQVEPISPLQKARNADKLLVTRSNLDLAFSIFPEQVSTFIDPIATFRKYADESGDEILEFRKQEQPVEPTSETPQ